MNLPRKDVADITEAMFVRPQRPDDHREFEILLPQCTPLFIYADREGRDWVRWAIPKVVAENFGLGEMRCACCDTKAEIGPLGAYHFDTLWDEISWYFTWLGNLRANGKR